MYTTWMNLKHTVLVRDAQKPYYMHKIKQSKQALIEKIRKIIASEVEGTGNNWEGA